MSDNDRAMSMSAMIHTTPDTRYDVHRQGGTGVYVVGLDDPISTTGATLFFRTLREFDRFVDALNEGRLQLTRRPEDEGPDREPSAAQERAWDEQYDGTTLGA